MPDIRIAIAPITQVSSPVFGPSVLKAACVARGLDTDIDYLGLVYAEQEGAEFCDYVARNSQQRLLLGDWVFSHLIRGTAAARPVDESVDWIRSKVPAKLAEQLIAARGRAAATVIEMADRLVDGSPGIIGFSSYFQQHCASLALAARIKEIAPQTLVCIGGPNVEGVMGRALLQAFPQVDCAFSGEADVAFPEFALGYLAGDRRPVSGRPVEERWIRCTPIADMDSVQPPDFADYFAEYDTKSYANRASVILPFESSRGCWWGAKNHCTFCALDDAGIGFRAKSPERMVGELRQQRDRWGVPVFVGTDNIIPINYIEKVFVAHRETLSDCLFFYQSKANLTAGQMRSLRAAGFFGMLPGIESLHDDVLKLMKKGVGAIQNMFVLRTGAELGMAVHWNFLTNFPGETGEHYAEIARMLPMLQHLMAPSGYTSIFLDRFSPYHVDPAATGFGPIRPIESYYRVYDLPTEILMDFAYSFEAERLDGLHSRDYLGAVPELIRRWQERWRFQTGSGGPARLQFRAQTDLFGGKPILLVDDTRDMAMEAHHVLTDAEQAVIRAFEKPAGVELTLGHLAEDWAFERSPRECFEDLRTLGYVIDHGGKAVHVIVDPTRHMPLSATGTARDRVPGSRPEPVREAAVA